MEKYDLNSNQWQYQIHSLYSIEEIKFLNVYDNKLKYEAWF